MSSPARFGFCTLRNAVSQIVGASSFMPRWNGSSFIAVLKAQAVKDRLNTLGASPIGSLPKEFEAVIRADYDKWGPIIKAAGMKFE